MLLSEKSGSVSLGKNEDSRGEDDAERDTQPSKRRRAERSALVARRRLAGRRRRRRNSRRRCSEAGEEGRDSSRNGLVCALRFAVVNRAVPAPANINATARESGG